MSSSTYSTYEAKAKFSEVLRKVARNRTVVVTSRGRPIAKIVPFDEEKETLAQRLLRLETVGVVQGEPPTGDWFESVSKSAGALKKFLQERGRP